MRDIENTKTSIGVDRLNDLDRKKLFNDFQKAGGEVISDKSKRIASLKDREEERTRRAQMYQEERNRRRSAAGSNKRIGAAATAYTAKKKTKNAARRKLKMSFFQNLKLTFHLRFMKVCESGCTILHAAFLDDLNGEYNTSFLETRLQFTDIFKKNYAEGNRVIDVLDKQKKLFYDLIEMSGEIYPQFFEDESAFMGVSAVSALKDQLMSLHRKLFLLYGYENTLFNGWLKAIDVAKNRDKEMYPTVAIQKRKIRDALYSIFHRLYPRLHWLMCLYTGKYAAMSDTKTIEEILEITPEEKPGFSTMRGNKNEDAPQIDADEEIQQEQKKEAEVDIPDDDVKEGLQLMASLDYKTLRKTFDPKDVYDYIAPRDKIIISFLLFTEFITEYAFLLNTNKIKFSGFAEDGMRINYAVKLRDLYYEIDKTRNAFINYAESVANYDRISKAKPYNDAQYLAYSKRVQEAINRRSIDGKNARSLVRSYLEKIKNEMTRLANDMSNNGLIVQNPQDIITLDGSVEKNKKLNGKKVYEAIHLLKCFSAACIYRMSQKGDLFGEFDSEAKDLSSYGISQTKAAPTEDIMDVEKLNNLDDGKSIIGQLEDII